jgi:tetratricopeptide (TPR) repeat protein
MGDQERETLEHIAGPGIEETAANIEARWTAALLSLLERKSRSLKRAAKLADLSPTYLYKLQSGGRKLHSGIIARLLCGSNVSFDTFLRHTLELEWAGKPGFVRGLMGTPPELLADWREPGAAKLSPFLEDLDAFLRKIERHRLADSPGTLTWRPVIQMLERDRLREWRKLRRRLERMILRSARRASRQKEISRMELADLATLFAAWAASQRAAGQRALAIEGLIQAFALAERSGDVWTKAFCLQKAAYLSHDLGHDEQGLLMIEKAAVHLTEAGDPDDLARLTVDRALFYFYCGDIPEAQRLFESGLDQLGRGQRLYRASAYLGLARIFRERGLLANASKALAAATEIHAPASLEAAYVMWEAGALECEFDAFEQAEPYFRESLRLFAKFGAASDVPFVALDFAELLLKAGRPAEMKSLFSEVLGWLAPLAQAKRSLMKVFENLSALLAMGTMTIGDLDNARTECSKRAVDRFRAEAFVG